MTSDSDTAIDVEALDFAYGARTILHGVSLRVGRGRVVGLLGPNGSGKSTLLKVVSGVLSGYRGKVSVMGQNVSAMTRKAVARMVASVPQESSFSFPFSVLEVVLMGRQPHLSGLTFESQTDIAIAEDALRRCGALELAPRSIHELSSGERQRVVFARALAQQPQVLLLDEPASALDIRYQVELYDIVRDLAHTEQCAVLTVLHDINLAAEYCDTVYLLADGRIRAGGNVHDVLSYSNLTDLFDTEVYVDVNALTGKPLTIPLSKHAVAEYKTRQSK